MRSIRFHCHNNNNQPYLVRVTIDSKADKPHFWFELAICMMASFDYNYQNPSLFLFVMLISAIVI